MILVAVDPGAMCGWLRWVNEPLEAPFQAEYDPFTCVQMTQSVITQNPAHKVVVVVERYTITSIKITPQYDAIEVIGALRYVTKKYGATLVLQSRADKARVSNDTLRRINWYHATKGGHANDASRHAVIYLARFDPSHPVVRQALATI